jgi:hypothetical protein
VPGAIAPVTATGSTTPRAVEDRFADVYNIRDYGAGTGGDDAVAFRACIGSNRIIFCPPGTYTFKSQVIQPGPFNLQPTPCLVFNGVQNLLVIADGCTFLIDDSITYPNAGYVNAGNAHCGFIGDCKKVIWSGGRFYGNTTHAGTAINTGMWFQNCSNFLIENTEWLGSYPSAPIFGGVWLFEFRFHNNRSHGSGNGWDFAYCESMTLTENKFGGGASPNLASAGFKLFTDPNTKNFNTAGSTLAVVTNPDGTTRQLRGGMSNDIVVHGNTFVGWGTHVYLDGIDNARVSDNTIRDGKAGTLPGVAGVTVVTTADTNTAGFITKNIVIHNNNITDNGGPGIVVGTGGFGLSGLSIIDNRIYDNVCPSAIYFVSLGAVGVVKVIGNDFLSRTGSGVQQNPGIAAGNMPTIIAAGGMQLFNLGIAPFNQIGHFTTADFSVNATLPNAVPLRFADTSGAYGQLVAQGDNNLVFSSTNASGALRPIWNVPMHSAANLVFDVPSQFGGTVGFNGAAPAAKPTVTGAKGSNAALASLLTALAAYGLVTDSTSA